MPQIFVSTRLDCTEAISAAHSMTTGFTFKPRLWPIWFMISPSTPMRAPFSSLQNGMSLSMATVSTPGVTVLIDIAAGAVGMGKSDAIRITSRIAKSHPLMTVCLLSYFGALRTRAAVSVIPLTPFVITDPLGARRPTVSMAAQVLRAGRDAPDDASGDPAAGTLPRRAQRPTDRYASAATTGPPGRRRATSVRGSRSRWQARYP